MVAGKGSSVMILSPRSSDSYDDCNRYSVV